MKTKNVNFKLKNKQSDILILLHRFRFLNRQQLQQLLNHKTYSKIITWLNELTLHKYIHSYYNQKFAGVSSVYCLASKSLYGFRRYKYLFAKTNKPSQRKIKVPY